MSLRSDPSLWYNMPGVVAAYQPVRAPDALNARHNMAHGGDSRYRAAPGVLPTWGGVEGWSFNGTTQWMDTGIVPADTTTWSMIVSYRNLVMSGYPVLAGWRNNAPPYDGFALSGYWNSDLVVYFNGAAVSVAPKLPGGVLAIAGPAGYRNGVFDTAIGTQTGAELSIYIGAAHASSAEWFAGAKILSLAVYRRTLSAAEVWYVSRQMAYCDVNPEWSVWSPRRKWYPYIAAAPAGRPGIFGARPTVGLPGGVRIVPQDEGGVNG